MEENIKAIEQEIELTDKDIFTRIWAAPRAVFKFINDNRYDKNTIVLLVLAGISRAFDRAVMKDSGDNMSLWAIIALSVVVGGLFGWISFYIYSALVSWTGKWLNGKGNTESLLRMFSYGMLPSIIALILVIPQMLIYGNEMFKSDGDITSGGLLSNILFYSAAVLEIVLGVWTIVLCVIGTSEVQKLSIGNAILNLLLPVIVILVPIFLIYFIFAGF